MRKPNYKEKFEKAINVRDFRSNTLENGQVFVLNKILSVIKEINPNTTFIWDEINKKEYNNGIGWFSYPIKGMLKVGRKKYTFKFYWKDNYYHTTASLFLNGIKVIELTKEVTIWDAGCSTTDNYLKFSDKLNDIF